MNHVPVVDIIIEKNGKILLIKRNKKPFKNFWVIPGGHVEYGETVEKAAEREAKEETGLKIKLKEILGVYSDPRRDSRYPTITTVFIAKGKGRVKTNLESKKAKWFRVAPLRLGFDHKKILKDYAKWKRGKQTFWSGKSKT